MSIFLIIAVVVIIAFFIFMLKFNNKESEELIEFKKRAYKISIDLNKAELKAIDKSSTIVTITFKHIGKEMKHEESVNKHMKYVKSTFQIRRETTLFIDPEDSNKVYLDLEFLYFNRLFA